MSQAFHVLHVRASNFVGGPEHQVLRYAEFDLRGPVQVTLASFFGGEEGKELLASADRMGISTLALPAGILGAFKSVSTLVRFIRERHVSLVCTHGYRADILGIWAARKCGVPVACFLRGWTKENWKVRTYEALDCAFLPRASRIVALSETQAERLRSNKAFADKVRVVVNAIEIQNVTEGDRRESRSELRRQLGLREDAPIVAAAGRLSPEKGATFFIRAIPLIREQLPGARFVLFGDGPLRSDLEGQAKKLGLSREIRFAGFVPDFPRLLPGVDILVNASLSEQMPNIVLEAMAVGVPVVATAVGGVPEICGDGALVLVSPGDPSAIAHAVMGLLSNPTRGTAVGLAGRRRVSEAYSPARQRAQLHALYEDLIPNLKGIDHREHGASESVSRSPTPVPSLVKASAPFISIVIPVRNEAAHLGTVLEALLAQDYPPERFEILVVDGSSTDGTMALAKRYARAEAPRVALLANPRRLSSAGRNVGVRASRGEIIVFIDGHCRIASPKLLAETAHTLDRTNADCLCRPQPLTLSGNTFLQDVIAHARATALGHGRDSTIYDGGREGFVNPTSSGATYRRSVFDRVGMFDESFDACEDVELNYRVFKGGFRAYSSPALAVYYHPRASLRGLFKQLVRYGRGRFRFIRKHPDAVTISQFVPPGFLAWVVVSGLAAFSSIIVRQALVATMAIYAAVVLGFSAVLGMRHGWRHFIVAPAVYPTIHFGLGAGFWAELGGTILRTFTTETQRHGGKKSGVRSQELE